MEFDQADLDAIERACRAQANFYRELASKVDRPIQRNQRLDAAVELERIATRIEQSRREQALLSRRCESCDD